MKLFGISGTILNHIQYFRCSTHFQLKIIAPFSYKGSLKVPYSKSYLQRAIAVTLLTKNRVLIEGYTPSKDALAAISVVEALGATTSIQGDELTIDASMVTRKDFVSIHCGEAGLSTRMFSPIAASLSNDVIVTGEGSIMVRPMDMVIDALVQLGADVESDHEKLPLHITGGIKPGKIEIDGSESSQLLTGVLIALAFLSEESTIDVSSIKSIPYVQMTLDILSDFGIDIEHENYSRYVIKGISKGASFPSRYKVEGDWSGASFQLVGAALKGEILLNGLNPNSSQADRAIVNAVKLAGAQVQWIDGFLKIVSGELKAFKFDATHCPDLFPPLAALAAGCSGISEFKGVSRLGNKESNRGLTIQSELNKLGIKVDLEGDLMRVHGGKVGGGVIDSHNDHRIAMMGAVMATLSSEEIRIDNWEAINKSYPGFFDDILSLNK